MRGHFRPGIGKDLWDYVTQKPSAEEGSGGGGEVPVPPKPPPAPKSLPWYVNSSVKALHEELFQKSVNLLLKKGVFFNSWNQRQKPPYKYLSPEALRKKKDFELRRESLLQPDNPSAGIRELLSYIDFLIEYSPHPSHPFNVSKNSAGLDPYGIVGDWMSTTLSQPVLTYYLAPVFTLMEHEVYRMFRNLVGYPRDEGDGMFVPSHGLGNAYAIQLAIQAKFPNAKDKGLFGVGNPKTAIFLSDQAYYGYEKYAIWEGLGSNACIRVKSDDRGRMNVKDLQKKIQASLEDNFVPIMIVATAGTNVLGAIDPIEEIAAIAKKYQVWLHVDGCLSASCVFSDMHRGRLKGIEKSDSVVWSPDKMLAAPFLMCIIVTRENKKIKKAFSFNAALVFKQEPFYDHEKWDTGDSTLQTTRRPDIVKIWFMWKAKGRKGLGDQVDGTYRNTQLCVNELKFRSPNFVLILPNFDSNLVCFYYIPKAIRRYFKFPIFDDMLSVNQLLQTNKITERIKNDLLKKGKMQISLGELPGKSLPKFFVMNMNNTVLTLEDIRYMLDLIEWHGDQIRSIVTPWGLKDGEDTRLYVDEGDDPEERIVLYEPSVPPPPPTYPPYVSAPIESMHKHLFKEYFKMALEIGTYFQDRRDDAPIHFNLPNALLEKYPVSLEDADTGGNESGGYKSVPELMSIVKDTMFYSSRLAHPYYIFQLVSALDPYTMVADYVATCITSPMFTYEDGPVYTIMEAELAKGLISLAEYPKGVAMPFVGGSIADGMPVFLAYINKFPEAKEEGIHGANAQGVIFHSENAHWATDKGAFFQGIGLDNTVAVKSDVLERMNVEDLRKKVEEAKAQNKVPFMVSATSATTVTGAFDPLNEIADVCEEYGMWLHVDGAYGGCVIVSDVQKYRLEGVERSDSFTFNPHKMFGAARYTTNWSSNHPTILAEVAPPPSKQQFRLNPDLYNQKQYDLGETSPLTDRRPDVFKMWFLWKAKGIVGLGAHVDRAYELTAYAYQELLRRFADNQRFQPVMSTPPEATNINFMYVPQELQGQDIANPEFRHKLECVQNTLLAKLLFNDKMMFSLEYEGSLPQHVLFCLYNTTITEEDINYFFDIVDYMGQSINLKKLFSMCPGPDAGSNSKRLLELEQNVDDK